jgi:VIT1/CCC1 family predicted Fe2+/Mn2+ transporter
MRPRHVEAHAIGRIGWLRAAVLGANDGIISTASLMVGVAAATPSSTQVLLTGLAGLVAGAMSMAAGEYVSVSSQADSEASDIARERRELATEPDEERAELANIYVERGLTAALADQVAEQMMAKDALAAHMRDELGLSEMLSARPVQAALTSALTFAAGAALPVLVAVFAPAALVAWLIPLASLCALAILGAVGAAIGGAPALKPTIRVTFWGALAMGATAGIGALIGQAV